MNANSKIWKVYLIKCSDNSYYCGITTDIIRRLNQHNDGIASKYTRSRRPVKLIIVSPYLDHSGALTLEYLVKHEYRSRKVRMILSRWERKSKCTKEMHQEKE